MARERKASVRVDFKDGVSKKAKKAEGAFTKLAKALSIGAIIAVATKAFRALAAVLEEATKLAGLAEQSFANVSQSLKSSGGDAQLSAKGVREWSAALEGVIGVSKEQIEVGFVLAESFGQTGKAAQELAATAANFAQGAGIAFEEAVRRIGRATQGSVDDVAKFVPAIKLLTKEQLAAGEATRLLAEKFEGAAKAASETYVGAMEQAAIAARNFKEELGRQTIEVDVASRALERQKIALDTLTSGLKAANTELGITLPTWQGLKAAVLEYTAGLVAFLPTQRDLITALGEGLRGAKAGKAGMDELAGAAKALNVVVDRVVNGIRQLTTSTATFADAAARTADIEDRLAKANVDLAQQAQALGFSLETELGSKVKALEGFLEDARFKFQEFGGSVEELARVEKFVAEETAKLKAEIQGTTTATDRQTEAANRASAAHEGLAGSVRAAASAYQSLRFNSGLPGGPIPSSAVPPGGGTDPDALFPGFNGSGTFTVIGAPVAIDYSRRNFGRVGFGLTRRRP